MSWGLGAEGAASPEMFVNGPVSPGGEAQGTGCLLYTISPEESPGKWGAQGWGAGKPLCGSPIFRVGSRPLTGPLPGGCEECVHWVTQHSTHMCWSHSHSHPDTRPVTARCRGSEGCQRALRRIGGHEQTRVHTHSASCRSVVHRRPCGLSPQGASVPYGQGGRLALAKAGPSGM